VNAVLAEVEATEAAFDSTILQRVVQEAKVLDIRTVEYQAEQQARTVAVEEVLPVDAVVLDIRAPDETESRPLQLHSHQVLEIPFFRLATQFPQLDQSKQYYCYCDRGVMSRLQALLLQEQGYQNVAVYRP